MTAVPTPTTAAPNVPSLADTASRRRRLVDASFRGVLFVALGFALLVLATLLVDVFLEGRPRLDTDLVRNMPSARPALAGIQSAIWGSLWVVGLSAAASVPPGIGTAVFLEEFAPHHKWYVRLIEVNIQNLAGVPSVVYGILGLAFVARGPLGWGFTVGSAAMVLTIMVLPVTIISAREAIRAVPPSLRDGSLSLGATKWQTVWRQVLPAAVPGIATGSILAVSRALGESAPLLLLGALTFVTFNPTGLDSGYTVLPLLIFKYASDAKAEFHVISAAAIVVLLVILVALNMTAILIRHNFEKRRA